MAKLSFDKIEKNLLAQQKEVEQQLQDLEKEDPVLVEGAPESLEPGTESWQQEVHTRFLTLKEDLLALSSNIKTSLSRIKSGKYGKCESCGNPIEDERLHAIPTAVLCVSCSKKKIRR